VVKWDQQCTEEEQSCTGGVGIVVSKSHATVGKASAAARPSGSAATGRQSLSSCRWYAPSLSSSALFMSRSEHCAPARRWMTSHWEPANALVRRVENLPMRTHTHGGRSGHFDLSAGHPPPNKVARKTTLCEVFMFWFLVFGLLCRHTASNPITAEMHRSGV